MHIYTIFYIKTFKIAPNGSLTQHNTRHTPTVRCVLSSIRLTQYDMLPHHQVNIRKLISECF